MSLKAKSIFLESAYFDPVTIRKGSKELGLLTEASRRFERGADVQAAETALWRVINLVQEIAGGELVPGIIDEYPEKVVDCFDLNKNDTEDFIQSLVHKISVHLIDEQDENEGIIDENTSIKPTGELDFEKIVGKVFEARPTTRNSRPLKVRRIEL